ncbi:MAG: response regulator transcription factor [Planctomycetota bacterium]|jgi:CheY-like chemotaxis protein
MAKKIYIIDDDMDQVAALTANLENAGYEVKAQYDDKDLVENLRFFNPDAIIQDVMFPGEDDAGFKMARTIRHADDLKEKPVIMLTGVNTEGEFPAKFSNKDIDEVYLPITEFVNKPADPKKIIEIIEKLTA